MNIRKTISGLGFIVALGTPLATLGDTTSGPIYDESGSHIAPALFGTVTYTPRLATAQPLRVGDVSADRQYVFLGDENGWQSRQMQYRYQSGSLAHVDDPAGHMARLADTRPLTEQERLARQSSAGR